MRKKKKNPVIKKLKFTRKDKLKIQVYIKIKQKKDEKHNYLKYQVCTCVHVWVCFKVSLNNNIFIK